MGEASRAKGQAALHCSLRGWDKALTPARRGPRPSRSSPKAGPRLVPGLLLPYCWPTPTLLRAGPRGRAVPSLEPAGPVLARRPAAPWRIPAPRAPVRAAGRVEAAGSALKRPDELSGPCRQPACLPPPPPRSDHSRSRHFKALAGLGLPRSTGPTTQPRGDGGRWSAGGAGDRGGEWGHTR